MLKTKSKSPVSCEEDNGCTQFTAMSKPGVVGEYFLNKKQLCEKVNLTFPFIWQMIREKRFPEGRAIGSRTLWVGSEVDAWMRDRPKRVYRPKTAEVA
jgi:predicted DNA-binding transcriptional regulator AlpA